MRTITVKFTINHSLYSENVDIEVPENVCDDTLNDIISENYNDWLYDNVAKEYEILEDN